MEMSRKVPLSDKKITHLINEVRTNQCIWNTDHVKYNNKLHVLTTWREIARKTNIPEDLIKLKWKNLRDLFRREIRRYTPQSVEEYNGKWRHFRSMWFLYQPGDAVCIDTSEEVTNNEETSNEEVSQEIEDDETNLEDDEETYETFVKCEPVENELDVFLEDPINTSAKKRKRSSADDDYDVMFLKSLTPYFKQLEPMRKLIVRSKMQDMLLNEIAAQAQISNNKRNNKNN